MEYQPSWVIQYQIHPSRRSAGFKHGVFNFPDGICPKVNIIARLEFELVYYDSAVQRFNHYTTKTSPTTLKVKPTERYYL